MNLGRKIQVGDREISREVLLFVLLFFFLIMESKQKFLGECLKGGLETDTYSYIAVTLNFGTLSTYQILPCTKDKYVAHRQCYPNKNQVGDKRWKCV